MSTITSRSVFYYGFIVSVANNAIDFDEGGSELQATLRSGDYTAEEYAAELQRALREAGSQEYEVTFNRTSRKITIEAPLPFTLRILTGSRLVTSAYSMAGFTGVLDLTGDEIESTSGAGSEYVTQYPVDQYVAAEDFPVKESATEQVSAIGVTQLISFGEGARVQMNIRLISALTTPVMDGFVADAQGVTKARAFIEFLLTKSKMEFMPDVANRASFTKLILESTQESRTGTSHRLKVMRGAVGFHETGVLTFRKVIE